MTDVRRRATARRRCDSSGSVQPLDEGGLRQRVATGGSVFGSSRRNLEPGNGTLLDESGVGGGITKITWNIWIGWPHLAPDGARVARVLPRDANRAIGHHRWISVDLKRVGAEE